MDKGYFPGVMEESTKANTKTTKKKDTEYLLGLMEGFIKDNGFKANNMV